MTLENRKKKFIQYRTFQYVSDFCMGLFNMYRTFVWDFSICIGLLYGTFQYVSDFCIGLFNILPSGTKVESMSEYSRQLNKAYQEISRLSARNQVLDAAIKNKSHVTHRSRTLYQVSHLFFMHPRPPGRHIGIDG